MWLQTTVTGSRCKGFTKALNNWGMNKVKLRQLMLIYEEGNREHI
jgi:hypothetical protein